MNDDEIAGRQHVAYTRASRRAKRERTLLVLFISIWRGQNVRVLIQPGEDPRLWTGPLLQRGLSDAQLREHLVIDRMGDERIEQVFP